MESGSTTTAGGVGPSDELADLFAEPVKVDAGGKSVEVRIMTIRQLGRAASIIRSIAKRAEAEGGVLDVSVESLIASYPDELIALVAVATGESEAFVGALNPAEFVALATVAFRVNSSFLLQAVAPRLATLSTALGMVLSGGPTSSPSSGSADTASPSP